MAHLPLWKSLAILAHSDTPKQHYCSLTKHLTQNIPEDSIVGKGVCQNPFPHLLSLHCGRQSCGAHDQYINPRPMQRAGCDRQIV